MSEYKCRKANLDTETGMLELEFRNDEGLGFVGTMPGEMWHERFEKGAAYECLLLDLKRALASTKER